MMLDKSNVEVYPGDAKKVFKKLGTCSRSFAYLLDREFHNLKEDEERAADPLAGGIMQEGYQCGMLWGSSLAVGKEAYKTCSHTSQAIIVSIEASKALMESFADQMQTHQCRDITGCNFKSNWSFAKYVLSGRFLQCFTMAEKWAPKAVKQARKAVASRPHNFDLSMSCASEMLTKMEASEEEKVMVAGFAGGLGLSGSGCGALGAAIWLHSLAWCRTHPKGTAIKNPKSKAILKAFKNETKGTFVCSKICGRKFSTITEHTDFVRNGGCQQLMETICKAAKG